MAERAIQPDEHAFIKNLMRDWGDEPVFTAWIRKEKHDRVQERILVIGKYRLMTLKRTFRGQKRVRRNGHLADCTVIESAGDDQVKICFKDKVKDWWVDMETPKTKEVIKTVRDSINPISVGWPDDALKINVPDDMLLPLESFTPSPGGGFIDSYKSMCNYYRLPISLGFCQHCQDIFDRNSTELDLSECPGIEPTGVHSFDLTPVFASLRKNMYFTSLKLVKVSRREVVAKFAECMFTNQNISTVTLQSVGCGPEGFVLLGQALATNKQTKLTCLDFSGNPIRNNGVEGLAAGIKALDAHGVDTLKLSNCSIGAAGLSVLMDAFTSNQKIALTLRKIHLDGNLLAESGSECIAEWLSSMRFHEATALRSLHLSNTKVSMSTLCGALGTGAQQLEELDLSENVIDKKGAEQFAVLLSSTGSLHNLNLAGCKLPKASILLILHAITHNTKVSMVTVNLAENDIGDKGAESVARGISGGNNLHSLILSDNALLAEGVKLIVDSCIKLPGLHTLALDRNVKKHKSGPAAEALASLISGCPSLKSLRISGSVKFHFGPFIKPLFDVIGNNSSLEEIDISGNHFDDECAQSLIDQLRSNNCLKALYWDDNRVTLSGYQMFKSMLNTNKTICVLRFPRVDVNAYVGMSKGSDMVRAQQKVKDLLQTIDEMLKSNGAAQGIVGFSGFIPFDDPTFFHEKMAAVGLGASVGSTPEYVPPPPPPHGGIDSFIEDSPPPPPPAPPGGYPDQPTYAITGDDVGGSPRGDDDEYSYDQGGYDQGGYEEAPPAPPMGGGGFLADLNKAIGSTTISNQAPPPPPF